MHSDEIGGCEVTYIQGSFLNVLLHMCTVVTPWINKILKALIL